jgi:fructokinase
MLGGVEAGGTKFVCVIGTGPDDIMETRRIDVAGPAETIEAALDFFRRALAAGTRLDANGPRTSVPDQPGLGVVVMNP